MNPLVDLRIMYGSIKSPLDLTSKKKILWHVDPILHNNREISSYITAFAK